MRDQRRAMAAGHVVGGPEPDILVEFPAIGPVLVLVDPVFGQMAGLFRREMGVGFAHTGVRVFQGFVAERSAGGVGALFLDPGPHAFVDRFAVGFDVGAGAGAQALDGDEVGDVFRENAGVTQRDIASQRMSDDSQRRQMPLIDQLREVVDVVRHCVMAGIRPLRVAMPAQIGCDDVILVRQRPRDPVPVAAMVAPAVDQQQRRRVRVPPIHVMQAQALREEHPRGWSVHEVFPCQIGGCFLYQPAALSYAAATRSTVASSKYRPTNCTETGRPLPDRPDIIASAGWPVTLKGARAWRG